MAKLSKSEVKAAISKIRGRKAPQPLIPPERFPRRNRGKRLAPVLADAGIDISKLEKIAAVEREELAHYQKKREQYYAKRNSALEKQYKATLENKKLALQAIAGERIGVVTVPVHTASAVDSIPDEILADERRQPWNNWIKFYHHDSKNTGALYTYEWTRYAGVKFFFAWLNPSDDTLVVHANTDLIIQGKCQAIAQGGFVSPGYVSMKLDAVLKAYPGLGKAIWGTSTRILEMEADTYAEIFGGDGGWTQVDLNEPRNVTLKHLLVKPRQVVIFEVSVDFTYSILNGIAEMEFTYLNRNVTCPALVIEYGGEPKDIGPA